MRKPRERSEADIYHVMARGTGRQNIFEDDSDRMRFLEILGGSLRTSDAELYAWCLMSNHIHLLARISFEALPSFMRTLLGPYAKYFNDRSGRVGHLFQERFESEPVADEAYLLTVIRYIHMNPVKAGLSSVSEWPWSSYREYVSTPRLCSTAFPLELFNGVGGFVRFHTADSDDICLDVPSEGADMRRLSDERARERASEFLARAGNPCSLDELKALDVAHRDECLVMLKQTGFTIKQLERLTGIGKSTIQRAGHVHRRNISPRFCVAEGQATLGI